MTLREQRSCAADPGEAWAALVAFPGWVDVLDTVDAVDVDESRSFPGAGSRYELRTGEGLVMRCEITAVETERRIEASVRGLGFLFRSRVCDEIVPTTDGCEVSRTVSYLGFFSRALALIWREREREELRGFTREWCWEAERRAAVRRSSAA